MAEEEERRRNGQLGGWRVASTALAHGGRLEQVGRHGQERGHGGMAGQGGAVTVGRRKESGRADYYPAGKGWFRNFIDSVGARGKSVKLDVTVLQKLYHFFFNMSIIIM